MKKSKLKILTIILLILSTIFIGINSYAHSGRTDSSGGHKDTKNKSGLGSYHYHCGGHPAHLHPNGVCPYSSTKSKSKSESSKETESVQKPTSIDVTEVKINEKIESIEVGESKTLTATVFPDNATDKNITWKSSDENIATISQEGKITGKKAGRVDITVNNSNGKTNTIKIEVKEEVKAENNTIQATTIDKNNTNNDKEENNQNDADAFKGFVSACILGVGGYFGYKKIKSKEKNK